MTPEIFPALRGDFYQCVSPKIHHSAKKAKKEPEKKKGGRPEKQKKEKMKFLFFGPLGMVPLGGWMWRRGVAGRGGVGARAEQAVALAVGASAHPLVTPSPAVGVLRMGGRWS